MNRAVWPKGLTNPFSDPNSYRQHILAHSLVSLDINEYSGKSFMCVFFTRFCGVGCPFCFFKSAPMRGELTVADQFTEEGIDKFIAFCNQANLGYVLISGGGEPLTQKRAVLRTIAEVETNRIVLVTSGNWAMNKQAAQKYLAEIDEAMRARKNPCKVTVRVSVSAGHAIKLGTTAAANIIELFESNYSDHPYLKFQIHAFENDPMLHKVLECFPGSILRFDTGERSSDDEKVIKVIPKKGYVRLSTGYEFIVGVSKVFNSGLRPNLHQIETHKATMKVFDRDLEESEDNNSAVLFNCDGKKGLDWSLNYNGNICQWQNQVNDNQFNIYEDSFDKTLAGSFQDPLIFSYIEKGRLYREKIISEVSPRAVLRQKAISLRDFSGTILFEEEKTRLYYAVRALQDYYQENRVVQSELDQLPDELKYLITATPEVARELYNSVAYTIVDQYKKKPFDTTQWHDLLELIKLGHYDLSREQIDDALTYYNERTEKKKYAAIEDVEHETGEDVQKRMVRRLMYMKPSSYKLLQPQLVGSL
jgi:organic radical activating enzyme